MYIPNENRYDNMQYNKCGNSGLKLPAISLGLWQNFGTNSDMENSKALICRAFDMGITHFDLANNYGPLPGSAESNFGKILHDELADYRDELLISTKAGYTMWKGPYGDWGSKKYLIASLDQSLKRMGLDYVDIFYHHRPDPNTPLEETAEALAQIVRQGKALYIGISNYRAPQARRIVSILKDMSVPVLIHQARYSMLDRWIEELSETEDSLCTFLEDEDIGCIAFSPLAQGMLTNRYLDGIPEDSRRNKSFTLSDKIYNETNLNKVIQLNELAMSRGESMAELAIEWILSNQLITSVLVGASRVSQLEENVKALSNPKLTDEELDLIDSILMENKE